MSSAGSGSELDINRPMSARAQVALEKISNSPETIRAMSEISKKMFLSTHDIRYVDPKLLEESKPTHGQASPTKGQTSEIDKAGPSTGKPPTQQPTGKPPSWTPWRKELERSLSSGALERGEWPAMQGNCVHHQFSPHQKWPTRSPKLAK